MASSIRKVALLAVALFYLNCAGDVVPEPNTPPAPVAHELKEEGARTVFSFPLSQKVKTLQHDQEAEQLQPHIRAMVYPAVSTIQNTKYGNNIALLGNTVEYYATLLIGTPGQTFTLQVDTGSAITAIPSQECTTCSHYNKEYNASASSTSNVLSCKDPLCSTQSCNPDGTCAFTVSYGDSSNIQGKLIQDVMALPISYTVNNGAPGSGSGTIRTLNSTMFDNTPIIFGGMTSQSSQFQVHGADGIMGLTFGNSQLSCVPNCASLVMDVLVQQYGISDIFSMALSPIENNTYYNTLGGTLTIGGIDPAYLNGANVFYTPVISKPYYTVAMGDITVGGISIGASMSDFGSAIVDSGTTYMVLPSGPYNALVSTFQNNFCNLPFVCGAATIFQSSFCVNASMMNEAIYPDLVVFLDSVQLRIPASQYMSEYSSTTGPVKCLAISNGGSGSKTILGASFMRGYYTVFDRQNSRVGFANSAKVSLGPRVLPPSNGFPIAIVIGAAVGGAAVVLIVIAIVVTVVVRRRRSRANESTADIGVQPQSP